MVMCFNIKCVLVSSCVYVCMCVCMRVYICVCVRARTCVRERATAMACNKGHTARKL